MAGKSKKRFSSATGVKNAGEPGYWKDQNSVGLYLKVRALRPAAGNDQTAEEAKPRISKNWIFRFKSPVTSKQRDMGLGSASDFTLKNARDAATEARKLVYRGIDPIRQRGELREARRVAAAKMLTFDQCAEQYIADKVEPTSKNVKHVAQWRNTITTYASPVMGNLPVNIIDDHHVLAVLEPIWKTKTVTATRVQQRMAKILNWAKVRKLRSGENPARWVDHLKDMLPDPSENN